MMNTRIKEKIGVMRGKRKEAGKETRKDEKRKVPKERKIEIGSRASPKKRRRRGMGKKRKEVLWQILSVEKLKNNLQTIHNNAFIVGFSL